MLVGALALAAAWGAVACESPERGDREAEAVGTQSGESNPAEEQEGASSGERGSESSEQNAGSASGSKGSCSEPSTCPEPDDGKSPEVTCYEPTSVPITESSSGPGKKAKIRKKAEIHIYGTQLVREDGPPAHVIFRPSSSDGGGGIMDRDVDVRSPCHVVATLGLRSPVVQGGAGAGSKLEFQLLRRAPTAKQRQNDAVGSIATDWHDIELTD